MASLALVIAAVGDDVVVGEDVGKKVPFSTDDANANDDASLGDTATTTTFPPPPTPAITIPDAPEYGLVGLYKLNSVDP